jgi:acylpyruvate hydrolase
MSNLLSTLAAAAAGAGVALAVRGWARRRNGDLLELLRTGRKAVCVGKNYKEHITELAQLGPEWKLEKEPEPVLFLKPTTSYAYPGEPLLLPRRRPDGSYGDGTHGVHHEVELGLIIGRRCRDVSSDEAMDAVAGFVLGLDMTERDEQTAAKQKGMPWSVSKGYDTFLPLSQPFTLKDGEDWRALRLWLEVNGVRRQECEAGVMIHSIPDLLVFISSVMTLEPGDLILTGTPKGVGRVVAGDTITAGVDGKVRMVVKVCGEGSVQKSAN